MLAREADGSMRDAQSLLEQVLAMAAPGAGKVDEALLQEVLGLAGRRMLYEISAAVLAGNAHRCLELVAEVVHGGRDVNRLARDLVEHFRNLLVARLAGGDGARGAEPSSGSTARLLDLPDQEIADLAAQSRPVSIETLLDYFDFMAAGDEEISRSPTPRFALESVLVRLAALPQSLPVSQLIERLERLEGNPSPSRGEGEGAPVKEKAAPAPRAAAAVEAPPPAHGADAWRGFVAALGREKNSLRCISTARSPWSCLPGGCASASASAITWPSCSTAIILLR